MAPHPSGVVLKGAGRRVEQRPDGRNHEIRGPDTGSHRIRNVSLKRSGQAVRRDTRPPRRTGDSPGPGTQAGGRRIGDVTLHLPCMGAGSRSVLSAGPESPGEPELVKQASLNGPFCPLFGVWPLEDTEKRLRDKRVHCVPRCWKRSRAPSRGVTWGSRRGRRAGRVPELSAGPALCGVSR